MYQLTIDAGNGLKVSEHPDWPTAHRGLIDFVIDADYYLQRIQPGRPHASYELLDLGDIAEEQRCRAEGRQPRTVGHAVIEELTRTEVVDSPYYTAAAAQRWITDNHVLWEHGADTDPGVRYPLTILSVARAEGRYLFCAGTLIREAAQLAGVDPITYPDDALLETLRHSAIDGARREPTPSPAALAAAVTEHIDPHTPPAQTATLIWWYALITWGATAS